MGGVKFIDTVGGIKVTGRRFTDILTDAKDKCRQCPDRQCPDCAVRKLRRECEKVLR